MPSNDSIVGVNKNRVGPAKPLDTSRNLLDLLVRVRTRVIGVRLKVRNRDTLDF